MLTALIAILIQIGVLTNAADYDTLTPEQQEYYQANIIIDDGIQM